MAKRYIVVKKKEREGKEDRYVTSSFPRPHLNQEDAVTEAIRLANKERKPFAIFEEVVTIFPSN